MDRETDPTRDRAPDQLRFSRSGETVVEVYDDGTREVHLAPAAAEMLGEYLELVREDFAQRFGREMRDDDPLFYDLDAPTPQSVSEATLVRETLALLEEAGIEPAFQYAFAVTGMLLTEESEPLFDEAELAAWDAAYDDYARLGPAALEPYR